MLSVLFLGVKMISGVTAHVWIMRSDLTNYLAQYQQGTSKAGFWLFVTREGNMARPHHPARYLAFGQETLAVFFCPSLCCVFRPSVCNSYYASSDISTSSAVSTSRATREPMQNACTMELWEKPWTRNPKS